MSWWRRYSLWMHVVETGGSWLVERDGQAMAVLSDPQFVDMFWLAWRIEPLNEADRVTISSPTFWDQSLLSRTVFRSREYGVAGDGFWAGEKPLRDGRLVMRGLYQPVREPWLWNELMMWVRRHWRQKHSETQMRRDFDEHLSS